MSEHPRIALPEDWQQQIHTAIHPREPKFHRPAAEVIELVEGWLMDGASPTPDTAPTSLFRDLTKKVEARPDTATAGERTARGHRNGCPGCDHDPGAYPLCWTDEQIAEHQRVLNAYGFRPTDPGEA